MRELKISNIKREEKIIYYIKDIFPNVTSSTLHKAFRNKDIKVNGKRINNEELILNNGDVLQIYIDDYLLFGFPKEVEVVFEDENMLVVYKPQGLLSNNEHEKVNEPTFEEIVQKQKGENIKICHRLDRNTGGLLIFAKNDEAYTSLLNGFRDGYVNKEYIAYAAGTDFKKDVMNLEKYIIIDNKTGYAKVIDDNIPGSQKISTKIQVLSKNTKENYSILKVFIHTGKTHQIRAQLSALSHPIIGDSKYGKNEINRKFKKSKQLLFAVRYTFDFPKTDYLSYLNNTSVELDKNYYTNKI